MLEILNNNLVLLFTDYTTGEPFLSYLGSSRHKETTQKLHLQAEAICGKQRLQLVPEIVAKTLTIHKHLTVREEEDNKDYILSLPDLVTMAGSRFAAIRQLTNRFIREVDPSFKAMELDLANPHTKKDILGVFKQRESKRGEGKSPTEWQAINRLFNHAHHYDLASFGIEIKGNLEAFIVCEIMPDQWSMGHFWKANTSYPGIYSYLMNFTAQQLTGQGLTKMNIQQDLGIDGLRRFKQSLQPIGYLSKYTIEA
jgi:hypothetical protein